MIGNCCLQAKISHGDETRVIHLASQITYAELLDNVKQKFPGAWPFQIKYLDRSVSSLPSDNIITVNHAPLCLPTVAAVQLEM